MTILQAVFKYQNILREVDDEFERLRAKYAEFVHCEAGGKCSICCYQWLPISSMDALNLVYGLSRSTSRKRRRILARSKEYETEIKHRGLWGVPMLQDTSRFRELKGVRCPVLDDSGLCALYAYRPFTCRIYGVMTENDPEPPCKFNFQEFDLRQIEILDTAPYLKRGVELAEQIEMRHGLWMISDVIRDWKKNVVWCI